ncbi:glutathione peroxidase [Chlorella sorokiniana]|uniref:Glutathione peroxidase n=1 Tax=Chlorella sorokiniana TaxID=3076 RepID=A0A2P6TKK4_CHLSO|nr:glutathione peroxidase [Chlorella sorokiniana]|eukprot:PRW44568.1 glutathione peroxidase [Chlorella sorokiniana]
MLRSRSSGLLPITTSPPGLGRLDSRASLRRLQRGSGAAGGLQRALSYVLIAALLGGSLYGVARLGRVSLTATSSADDFTLGSHSAAHVAAHIAEQQALPQREGPSLYTANLSAVDIRGNVMRTADLAGKVAIIVNVASNCGFTDANYRGLHRLFERYKAYGLQVIAFPCNQFGEQEPGTHAEIEQFVASHYGVQFPLMSKVEVNGPAAHPLFSWLKQHTPGDETGFAAGEDIRWNFEKFLIDKHGNAVKRYGSDLDYHDLELDVYNELINSSRTAGRPGSLPPMEQAAAHGRAQLPAAGWHAPLPCVPLLLGRPELPFSVRYNLTSMRTDALLDYISLVFTSMGTLRFRPHLFPAATAWMALHFAMPLTNIAWRRRCLAAHPTDGGSWGRWRELLCALVRATCSTGVTWQLVLTSFAAERGMHDSDWHGRSTNLAFAALSFVNVTAAAVIIMLSFKPMRVSYALPLQMVMTYVGYARYASTICIHPSMQLLQLQPLLAAAADALDRAALVLHPMLPRHGARAHSDTADCASLIAFLQFSACLLAALYKAHEELSWFELHQWQRAQRGLPPESGWDARVYSVAADLLQPWSKSNLLWGALLALILWHAVVALQSIGRI